MSLLRRMTLSRVQIAERALQKGDLQGAITAMEESLKRRPADVKMRRQLADTYAKAGSFDAAVRELTTLASAFAAEGLVLKATSACKAALDIDPDHEESKAILAALQANKSSALAGGAAALAVDDDDVLEADDFMEASSVEDPDDVVESDDVVVSEVEADDVFEADDLVDADDVDDVEEIDDADADALIIAEGSSGSGSDDDVDFDHGVLAEMPLFADLPLHAFEELVSDLEQWRVPADAVILREGEPGRSFFVIVSGEARVERDGKVLATLGRAELFGEMALLSKGPRTASVVADSACELFEVTSERIDDIKGRYPSVDGVLQRFCRERLLSNVLGASLPGGLFEGLSEVLVREMTRAFRTVRVPMGKRVVTQGEKGRGLFVVLSGALDVSRDDDGRVRTVSQLKEGDVFGEMSLLLDEPASASVMALENTTVLALSRQGFRTFCKRHPSMKRRLEELARRRLEQA